MKRIGKFLGLIMYIYFPFNKPDWTGEDSFGTVIIHERDDSGLAGPLAEGANDEAPTMGSLEGPAIGHYGTKFSVLRCFSFLVISSMYCRSETPDMDALIYMYRMFILCPVLSSVLLKGL